jgi:hypothetical protein
MLPLGDSWAGLCRAAEGAGADPGDDVLRRFCNLGYARGECLKFPAAQPADAVRFAIARDSGDMVQIRYSIEGGHLPVSHGTLEFDRASGAVGPLPPGGVLARQALAYVTAYRRRKGEPGPV